MTTDKTDIKIDETDIKLQKNRTFDLVHMVQHESFRSVHLVHILSRLAPIRATFLSVSSAFYFILRVGFGSTTSSA